MKTGDLARLLGVSDKTVRVWVESFSEFFSESRTKQRTYTKEDAIILATIAKFSHEGYSLSLIREKLASGERVEYPSEGAYGVDTRLVPAAAMEQVIDATELRIELEQIKAERDKLLEILDRERGEHHQREDMMRVEVKTLQDQIALLQRELGRAEGELNYRREVEKKQDKDN